MISIDAYKEWQPVFDVVLIIRGSTKVVIDVYMFGSFYSSFMFLVAMKR